MAEVYRGNMELAQQAGKKETPIFNRGTLGATVEYGGLAVAAYQLFKLNPIGIAAGLGLWVGGRWIRHYNRT